MTPHIRPGFDKLDPQDDLAEPAAILLATLAIGPHSGFDATLRQQALTVCGANRRPDVVHGQRRTDGDDSAGMWRS